VSKPAEACLYRLFCIIQKFQKDTVMKFDHVKGSIVAMVTPFNEDGSVNYDVLDRLIERQIAGGTAAILCLGTTAEYPTMTHDEDREVVRRTIERVDGRVPVIVGSGSNSTATQLEMSLRYQDMGADALLLITPYYNKANPEGMYRHFATTADAVHIPCILYNVPGRTGCSIPVSVVERLAKHPNVCGIKEASGNMSYAMQIAHCLGPDFQLWSGNDDITIPLMSIGGSGVISVLANVAPAETAAMVDDWLSGRHEDAARAQIRWLDLINHLFIEVNPIPVKTAMNMMGLNVGPLRLPLCEMTPEHKEALRVSLKRAGLL
jgi:4-hydroxy-tetrahydrodipicolinate synthase